MRLEILAWALNVKVRSLNLIGSGISPLLPPRAAHFVGVTFPLGGESVKEKSVLPLVKAVRKSLLKNVAIRDGGWTQLQILRGPVGIYSQGAE